VKDVKIIIPLVLVIAIFETGCSWVVYSSGKEIGIGTSREAIIQKYGQPDKSLTNQTQLLDEYLLSSPVRNYKKAGGAQEGFMYTFGLYELVAAPYSWIDQFLIRKHKVRVIYDYSLKDSDWKVHNVDVQ